MHWMEKSSSTEIDGMHLHTCDLGGIPMKKWKKMISFVLIFVILAGLLAGCQEKREVVLKEDGTSEIQNKTAIVAYNSVG